MKTIKIKKSDDGECYFDIAEVLEGTTTRPSTVKYYKLEAIGESMVLTLYNKNKRKIKLKEKK